jgi:transcriptional regulator with XRE-family HTH domain
MPDPDTFAGTLTRLREARGLTVYALAKAAGVDASQLRRIESGERMPTWPTLRKLASALGVSLAEFDHLAG